MNRRIGDGANRRGDGANRYFAVFNGFTLVELLVVVAIILLLAALLLPALTKAKERGRRAVCLSNQRQIAICLFAYAADFNGFYPGPNLRPRPNQMAWTGGAVVDFRPVLKPYVVNPRVLYCPSNLGLFSKERGADPLGPGWYEGWDSTNGYSLVSYAVWPAWTYNGNGVFAATWTDPTEQASDHVEEGSRKVLASDLTQSLDLFPTAGYTWYNHRRGGGDHPLDPPGTPEWAAVLYSDGSVLSTPAEKWTVHVQVNNGAGTFQYRW